MGIKVHRQNERRRACEVRDVTGQPDLAIAIAAAINPLLQAQLDEQRVNELIDTKVGEPS